MDKTIKKYNSFKEQQKDDIQYWKSISADQKLEILEAIRAQARAINNEHPRRLQRVYRIITR